MKAIISLILSLVVVGLSAAHMLKPTGTHPSHSVGTSVSKPLSIPTHHSRAAWLPRVSNLPNMGRATLDGMANQGLLYGIQGLAQTGGHQVILFVSRAPNAPRNLTIQHWPSLRFAAVASGSSVSHILGGGFRTKVHWIKINPRLLVK